VGLAPDTIAQGLEAPNLADVADPTAHTFRAFAEQTKSDLRALAACLRGSRQPLERDQLARITVPVLVATGTRDTVAGSPDELAALIPGAQALPTCWRLATRSLRPACLSSWPAFHRPMADKGR
jgi:pimeloyl-ACP methyl ester carboxylesterase